MKVPLKSFSLSIIAVVAWFALILQFAISIPSYAAAGRSLPDALLQLISFFTIQTNLLVAIASTVILLSPRSAIGIFFNRSSALTALALYIIIVGLVYAVALKHVWAPQGWFKVADTLLHEVDPLLFVLFWLFVVPKEKLPWKLLLSWAIFPIFYLVYTLVKGLFTAEYPYPFLNAVKLGYVQVLINSLMILLAFLAIGSLLIGITRIVVKTITPS